LELIGGKTEQEFREQLINSHFSLFNDKSKLRLLNILKNFIDTKSAYIIDWIPEQGEDIYTILNNSDIIAIVELDRLNQELEPVLNTLSINEFKKGLSKINQIKLAVAIDLAMNN
jgi:hypothetical protein